MFPRRRAPLVSVALSLLATIVLAGGAAAYEPYKLERARSLLGPTTIDRALGRSLTAGQGFVPETRSNFQLISTLSTGQPLNADVFLYDHGGSVGKHAYVG